MKNRDIRWKQRFKNFEKAYLLLSGAFAGKAVEDFDELQKEGLIQRFEYTFELLWKTLKDYLEYENVAIEIISPKNVIKAAATSNVLELTGANADILLDMLMARNLLSHTYDENRFVKVLERLKKDYLPEMAQIYYFFRGRIDG